MTITPSHAGHNGHRSLGSQLRNGLPAVIESSIAMNRRELLRSALYSGLLVRNALGQAPGAKYSVLLKGGRVIDPAQGLNAVQDVAIADGNIAAVEPDISPRHAARTVNVSGQIVTPGLIDLHTHGF